MISRSPVPRRPNSYNNGASVEMNLCGGCRFDLAQHVNADVGVLFYVYPGACTDLKLSLNKEWVGLNFRTAVVGTDAKQDDYQVANAGGVDAKRIGTTALLLSVGKTF